MHLSLHEEHDNEMSKELQERLHDDQQENSGWVLLNIYKWTKLPMPEDVILRMHQMAEEYKNDEGKLTKESDNIISLEVQERDNKPHEGFNDPLSLYAEENSNIEHEHNPTGIQEGNGFDSKMINTRKSHG